MKKLFCFRVFLYICLLVLLAFLFKVYLWGALIGVVCLFALLYLDFQTKEITNLEDQSTIAEDLGLQSLEKMELEKVSIPLVIVDSSGKSIQSNEQFRTYFHILEGEFAIVEKLGISQETFDLGLPQCFTYDNQECHVVATPLVAEDRTDLWLLSFPGLGESQMSQLNEEVFCYILVDNFDEILEQLPTYDRAIVMGGISRFLTEWASSYGAYLQEYENDHYVMIFERGQLEAMQKEGFRILDAVREMDKGIPVTLSMGIGVSNQHITVDESAKNSRAALDIALARGGDQCVVSFDEKLTYYGGKTEATEKRTKVKARVKAHALRELIKKAENVVIMGHQTPDADCLGSAIGILAACKSLNKEAHFILKEVNYSIASMVEYLGQDKAYEKVFVRPAEIMDKIKTDTLLVVVDTQSQSYVEMAEIIPLFQAVVVIDHHRRSGKAIENVTFNYIETYASSACELVAEVIQYFDVKDIIQPMEANVLLAGMYMDTKMFTVKTGVRTFEAAAYLKRRGADTVVARTLLQSDIDTYKAKSDTVKQARIYENGIAISSISVYSDDAKLIAAQAADELLNIKGINASFILLKAHDGISISGRSMGEINVQLILEKLGGGGHLTVAGAQLKNIYSLVDAESLLVDAIILYEKESEKE